MGILSEKQKIFCATLFLVSQSNPLCCLGLNNPASNKISVGFCGDLRLCFLSFVKVSYSTRSNASCAYLNCSAQLCLSHFRVITKFQVLSSIGHVKPSPDSKNEEFPCGHAPSANEHDCFHKQRIYTIRLFKLPQTTNFHVANTHFETRSDSSPKWSSSISCTIGSPSKGTQCCTYKASDAAPPFCSIW